MKRCAACTEILPDGKTREKRGACGGHSVKNLNSVHPAANLWRECRYRLEWCVSECQQSLNGSRRLLRSLTDETVYRLHRDFV